VIAGAVDNDQKGEVGDRGREADIWEASGWGEDGVGREKLTYPYTMWDTLTLT
jgi:hypothetical protein